MSEEGDHVPHALPHTWQVTSDSIAARLAVRLSARARLLLKGAPLGDGLDPAAAARSGLVDPWFPIVARPIERVLACNLRGLDWDERVPPPCYKPAEGSSLTLLLTETGAGLAVVGRFPPSLSSKSFVFDLASTSAVRSVVVGRLYLVGILLFSSLWALAVRSCGRAASGGRPLARAADWTFGTS